MAYQEQCIVMCLVHISQLMLNERVWLLLA